MVDPLDFQSLEDHSESMVDHRKLFKGRPGEEQCSMGGASDQDCKRVWKRYCDSTGIQKNPELGVDKAHQELPIQF